MRPRGLPLQGVDTGCQKGAQAGHNLLEDLRGDLTFLKQLRFSNGVSGVHGSAPSGAHIFVSRPQKEFIHNDLEHVNEAKTVELAHLQAAEFLYETRLFPEREFTFKHALTHEVAYSSLLQERRRVLHARIVEALEGLYPDRLAEQVECLAHHA